MNEATKKRMEEIDAEYKVITSAIMAQLNCSHETKLKHLAGMAKLYAGLIASDNLSIKDMVLLNRLAYVTSVQSYEQFDVQGNISNDNRIDFDKLWSRNIDQPDLITKDLPSDPQPSSPEKETTGNSTTEEFDPKTHKFTCSFGTAIEYANRINDVNREFLFEHNVSPRDICKLTYLAHLSDLRALKDTEEKFGTQP